MGYFELRHEGSRTSFLCALGYVLSRGEAPALAIREGEKRGQGSFVFEGSEYSIRIEPHEKSALSVLDALSRMDPALPEELGLLFAAEPMIEAEIFAYLLDVRERGLAARFDYSNPNTRIVRSAHKRVEREIHRMLGLLRFEESAESFLVARMEPDNDILEKIAPHFFERMRRENFLIIDMKRGKACAKQGSALRFLESGDLERESEAQPGISCSPADEAEAASLWRIYYAAVEVEGRRNPGLRRRFMPARYWKYLPELRGL